MSRFVSASVVFASCVSLVIACSSSSNKPPPSTDGEFDAGVGNRPRPDVDAADAADAADADADANASNTCRSLTKDGDETDVDCGGTCEPCALGKGCRTKSDCNGAAECENKICALCHDNVSNGDETDVDCGGKACGPCSVGKRCEVATDCRSAACKNDACACPQDMTIVALASGGAYCIDQSEVSKGQYNKFITANVPVTDQTGACLAANETFVPRGAWPPAESPGPLEFNLGLPVHYVDWCDAVAYCTWAKKQLCGAIGGAPLAPADANQAAKSAWYNACSAQGTKTYPYGAVAYDPARCNGDGAGVAGPPTGGPTVNTRGAGFGYAANEDDGVYAVAISDRTGTISGPAHNVCHGGSVGVYQMSGNLAEWEDSCDGAEATSTCRVRGGSYADANGPSPLRCDAERAVERMPAARDTLKDLGIRCCAY